MRGVILSNAIKTIRHLARYHPLDPIDVNGHGETTYMEGWTDACLQLLEEGCSIRLTSNFAKEFSADELAVLARMHSIAISIDTSDRQLLRRMRRKVDLRQIVTNIALVRATARKNRQRQPHIQFLAGLYDKNSLLMEDFAAFAVSLGITSVSVWSLTPYPYELTDVTLNDQAIPLDHLSDSELIPRLGAINRASQILQRGGVDFSIQGDFVNALARKRGLAYG